MDFFFVFGDIGMIYFYFCIRGIFSLGEVKIDELKIVVNLRLLF